MRLPNLLIIATSTLCLVGGAMPRAMAGDLNPPIGSVQPTGRFGPRIEINDANTPGDDDSLYKITQPGSYYLAENLSGIGIEVQCGIEISASNVTIDLNGFELRGDNTAICAIRSTGGVNLAVRNGNIQGWNGDGIDLGFVLGAVIEDVRIGFTGSGIESSAAIRLGPYGRVSRCTVQGPQFSGIVAAQGCVAESCIVSTAFNGDGFQFGDGAIITGCFANQCSGAGISVGISSTVTNCASNDNSGDGIKTGANSTVTGCVAESNGNDGIDLGAGSIALDCAATLNDIGFRALSSEVVFEDCTATQSVAGGFVAERFTTFHRCYAKGNGDHGFNVVDFATFESCQSFTNGRDGFRTEGQCTFFDCVASANSENGIQANDDSMIVRCKVEANLLPGIAAFSRCLIQDNLVTNHSNQTTGRGIAVVGSDTRVDGNHLVNNATGIRISGTDNFVVRNTVKDASVMGYDITGVNDIATIRTTPVGAGPWDNFLD